jgi:deoxycytidine triphosphate deaminase
MFLNAHQIEPLIQGTPGKKAQVGIDLTVCDIKSMHGGALLKDKTELQPYATKALDTFDGKEGWYLISGHAYSVTFDQGVELTTTTMGWVIHRSSLLRMGWTCLSGIYDPSFKVDQMGAVLMGNCNIFIEKGARIAQLVLSECAEADAYRGQWYHTSDVK